MAADPENDPRPGDLEMNLLRKILSRLAHVGGSGLDYTPENVANKSQSLDPISLEEYPSSRAVALYVGTRILGAGSAQLVAGSVVVTVPQITSGCSVQLTHRTIVGTAGHLSFVITDGVGFTINSTSGTDAG